MQSTSFLIPNLIDRVGRGLGVHIQNPDARRDLIYVGDVADAIETLDLRLPDDIDCLNICTGDAPTMRDVANLVIEAHGADPGLVTYGNNATRDGALQFSGSTDLAFSVLAWKPQISLREGIERTVSEWKARNDD
jgi:nucleoside-diphosphate-sugar epimerase